MALERARIAVGELDPHLHGITLGTFLRDFRWSTAFFEHRDSNSNGVRKSGLLALVSVLLASVTI